MLVNESTLRAVVRKYLLKELNFLGPITRGVAASNFLNVDPDGLANSPDSMIWNPTIDGRYAPQQNIRFLYAYVNQNNFVEVYNAIITILKNHAKDLDANENEIESLYARGLQTSLNAAAKNVFQNSDPLPPEVASLTLLPPTPAGANDATIVAQRDEALAAAATPTAAGANKAFETSGPNYENRKINCVTKFVNLLKTYGLVNDGYVFPNQSLTNYQEIANVLYQLIDNSELYNPYKFKILAHEYLKSCYRNNEDRYLESNFENAYEHDKTLKTAGATPAPTPAPAAAEAAPAAKPKPAADWNSYVKMTRGGQGAAVKSAWEAYAARLNGDTS
jgi:hypothetical protein